MVYVECDRRVALKVMAYILSEFMKPGWDRLCITGRQGRGRRDKTNIVGTVPPVRRKVKTSSNDSERALSIVV